MVCREEIFAVHHFVCAPLSTDLNLQSTGLETVFQRLLYFLGDGLYLQGIYPAELCVSTDAIGMIRNQIHPLNAV